MKIHIYTRRGIFYLTTKDSELEEQKDYIRVVKTVDIHLSQETIESLIKSSTNKQELLRRLVLRQEYEHDLKEMF